MIDRIARKLGNYDYGDAVLTRSRFTSITLKDGIVENVREGETNLLSVRIMQNKTFGFASTNRPEEFEKTASIAAKLAKLGKGEVALAEPESHLAEISPKVKDDPRNHSLEEKIADLKGCVKMAQGKFTRNTLIVYHDSVSNNSFANSAGALITENEIRTGAGTTVYAKKGALIESSLGQVKEKAGYEIMERLPEIVVKAAKEAGKLLSAKHGPRGKMAAVLDPELAGVMAHEAVGHACEADGILNGSSCLEGKLGKKIGNGCVTIKDSPVVAPQLWGSYLYDDEGTRAEGTTLVKNGILNSYLTNLESAAMLEGKLTANGRGNNSMRQIVRMSNTYFEKGDSKEEELFEGVKDGIYLVGCKEGQVSPKVGNFTFAAKY
ncbi:MAG: TldD/PmbA family protein, partial [Candidatus Micrarchaeota archaeon]